MKYPTDLVVLVVLWRLRYKLSLRDLAEMLLERGFIFSHETVRDWDARLAPLLIERLRAKHCGQGGMRGHADETYIKINGLWCYLYRAIEREGKFVDARLSERRDMAADRRFFRQALDTVGHAPEQFTTDRHNAYPCAIRETLGGGTIQRTSCSMNNRIAPDHRGIKQRYYPMRGFDSFAVVARFASAFEEQRQYFRAVSQDGERVSSAERRIRHREC